MKILICGAGFAGLALAASLQKEGHAVTLIEKQPDHQPLGFVIGLWSNGLHTLEQFGVLERIQQLGMPVTEEVIRYKTGRVLANINYRPLIELAGPVLQILHSDLQQLLRGLTVGIPLRFETTISALEQQPHRVVVTFNDGTQEDFELVVGADGIHSQVRTLLFGREGLEPSDLRMWFTLLNLANEDIHGPNDLFGEGEYVGIFPTRTGQAGVLFLAAMHHQAPESAQERIAYLQKRFDDFGWVVPDILNELHNQVVFAAPIEQVSLHAWYQGRVVLLGDAAHAVSPTAALGGAMALEDAHVLAEELRGVDAGQVEQALARYVARRQPRVAQVRHTSNFMIWLASMNQPAMTFMRNNIMHLLPSSLLLQGMGSIVETQA